MQSTTHNKYKPEQSFDAFLKGLQQQDDVAWNWLLDHFREKVIPYIRKIDGRLSKDAIVSVDYFIEEIFANSLIKFYEMFAKGEFASLAQLRGLMFRIAELKLKEAYRQIKKDRLLYFPTDSTTQQETAGEDPISLNEEELIQQQAIQKMESALKGLTDTDQAILLRFAKGEKLKDIARQLKIDEASCRKRKQRALQKMRSFLRP